MDSKLSVSIVLFLCFCKLDSAEAQSTNSYNKGIVIFVACVAVVFTFVSLVLLCLLCIVLDGCKRCHHGKVCPDTTEKQSIVIENRHDYKDILLKKRSLTPKLLSASYDRGLDSLGGIEETIEDAIILENPSFIKQDRESSSESELAPFSRQSKRSDGTIVTNLGAEDESPLDEDNQLTLI